MINVDVDRNPQATIGRTMYKSQLVTQRGKEQGKARVIKLEKSGAGRTLKMNNSWQYAKHVQVRFSLHLALNREIRLLTTVLKTGDLRFISLRLLHPVVRFEEQTGSR